MINPFKKILEKRKQRKTLKELAQTNAIFGTLNKLERSGLLAWNEADRRLFLSEPLAMVMLERAETWRTFLSNVNLWCHYNRVADLWQNYLLGKEMAAVRKAKMANPMLTDDEAVDIRINARMSIPQEEMANINLEVKSYEFFIVSRATTVNAGSGAKGKIWAVGRYEPESNSIDMVPWDEIESKIRTK